MALPSLVDVDIEKVDPVAVIDHHSECRPYRHIVKLVAIYYTLQS